MPGLPVARRGIRQVDVNAMTRSETRRRDEGIVFVALFALTIPAANWLIGHAGTVCQPAGLCLVPVAPGLMAPSGVIMAGAALVLRDLVQRRLGAAASSLAILVGAILSAALAPPALVIASAAAFLLSEFADLAVYTPLVRRGLIVAVVASSVVGLVGDATGASASRRRDAGRTGSGKRCANERGSLRHAAGDHHSDHHHHAPEKRNPALLDERAPAARFRRRSRRGSRLHAPIRAGARGPRHPGKLGEAGFNARRHRSNAGRLHRSGRRDGRHLGRHFRRYPDHAHGEAEGGGAGD